MTKKEPRIPIPSRIRLTSAATVAKWMAINKIPPRNKSDFIHKVLEAFKDILINNEVVKQVETVEEAVKILRSIGITWEAGNMGHEQLIQGLRMESIDAEEDPETVQLREEAKVFLEKMESEIEEEKE